MQAFPGAAGLISRSMKVDLNYNALVLKARRCFQAMDPAVLSIMSPIAVEPHGSVNRT